MNKLLNEFAHLSQQWAIASIATNIKNTPSLKNLFGDRIWVSMAKGMIRRTAQLQDKSPLAVVSDIDSQLKGMHESDRRLVLKTLRGWFETQ